MRLASAAFLVRGSRVLLAKRSPDREFYPDVWDAVGGHIEPGETPTRAIERELREELGIRSTRARQVAVLDEPNPDRYGPAQYYMFAVTEWAGGEPTLIGAEHVSIRWCDLGGIRRMRLAHPDYEALICDLLEEGS